MNLTKQEKLEIKNLIKNEMVELRDYVTTSIADLNKEEEIDEDTELCTHYAEYYSKYIDFYLHLYDDSLNNTTVRDFWKMDTGYREEIWEKLRKNLHIDLYIKIEKYISEGNKEIT